MSDSRKQQSSKGLRIAIPSVAHSMPTDTCLTDPNLTAVIDAWDGLPEAVRASILMLVKAAKGGGQ